MICLITITQPNKSGYEPNYKWSGHVLDLNGPVMGHFWANVDGLTSLQPCPNIIYRERERCQHCSQNPRKGSAPIGHCLFGSFQSQRSKVTLHARWERSFHVDWPLCSQSFGWFACTILFCRGPKIIHRRAVLHFYCSKI